VSDPGRDLDRAPDGPFAADQRHAMMAALDDHHLRIAQLAPRELDLYGNQLARCLKAMGTEVGRRRVPARSA
jgi:hypothetical protein